MTEFTSEVTLGERPGSGARCPMCNQTIAWVSIDSSEPFPCPHCKEVLRLSSGYFKVTGSLHLVLAAFTCWAVGVRGAWLIPSVAATYAVVSFVSGFVLRRVWPP